jgi:hypothetical protein
VRAEEFVDGQGQGLKTVAGGVELAEQGGELGAEGCLHAGQLVHRGFAEDREEAVDGGIDVPGPGQGGGL